MMNDDDVYSESNSDNEKDVIKQSMTMRYTISLLHKISVPCRAVGVFTIILPQMLPRLFPQPG